MQSYVVNLISKDKNGFEFNTFADNKDEAIKKAFNRIKELYWDNYGYELKEVRILNKNK